MPVRKMKTLQRQKKNGGKRSVDVRLFTVRIPRKIQAHHWAQSEGRKKSKGFQERRSHTGSFLGKLQNCPEP